MSSETADQGGMRLPPASVVESWPAPNYTDPVTRGNALLVINVIFQGLATIAVAGRLYSRYIKKWFGIDDALIIMGYVFDCALTTVIMLAKERYGWNRHEWDLPPNLYSPASKITFIAKVLFGPTVTCIRLSLIAFYYRLVKDSGVGWFKWVLHVSTIYTILVCLAFLITAIVECSPTQAYWTFPPKGGHCLNEGKVLIGCGVTNSVSDLLTTILPIPIIARLQMPLRQRIGVGILLCLGLLVTVAGAVRIYFTWDSLIASYDESWRAYPLWIATAVEIHLGLISACAPAWRPLLAGPMSKLFGRVSSLSHPSCGPHNRQTTTKRTFLNPLKSLAWFQHARFDFERIRRDHNIATLIEKSGHMPILTEGDNPTDGRHYEITGGPSESGSYGSGITVTKSIDISSIHLTDVPQRPDAPLSWIWHKRGTSMEGHDPSTFV